jgi:hypothetical protein
MVELEYEVLFVYGSVNVMALAYVDEGDFTDDETLEQVAIRRALDSVCAELGGGLTDFDEVTATHSGTIGG